MAHGSQGKGRGAKNVVLAAATSLAAAVFPASAQSTRFTIDTGSLAGTPAAIAFDLIDGGPPSNSVILSGFASDGILGSATSSGSVTGTLPGALTFSDTAFFSEYLQDITLGSQLSFVLNASANAPGAGSFPDSFSVFLLDATGLSLPTSDPSGAGALFSMAIGDGSAPALYSGQGFSVSAQPFTTAVPEPASIALLLAGLAFVGGIGHCKKKKVGNHETAMA